MFFPMNEYWLFYVGFMVFVITMLILDLGVFHKKDHEVSVKESAIWTVVWIGLAFVFAGLLYFYSSHKFMNSERLLAIPGFDGNQASKQVFFEFITGFIIEKALAIDNVFVFIVVFNYFAIPRIYQHRVLFYGIFGALIFRAIFIAIGAALMQYHWVVIAAGVFLIATGIKILVVPNGESDPGKNPMVKLVRKLLPVSEKLDGNHFFTIENGVRKATPLLLALAFIEFSDIIFAIDSVPAIYAVTKEPFIVFTSNVFAIMGLRSLYFILANIVHLFRFLKYGLGFILVFVGLKMVWLNDLFGGKFPVGWSLAIIGGILGISVLVSVLIPEKKQDPKGT